MHELSEIIPIKFVYVDVLASDGSRPYGPFYVNNLIHAVDIFYSLPHSHLCLTDAPDLSYECSTELVPGWYKGWWAKILLFRPRQFRLVFLDLDTLILDNINFLSTDFGDMVILQDFYYPTRWGSAIISLREGDFGHSVYDHFSPSIMQFFRGDQDWIFHTLSESLVGDIVLWQNCVPGKISSYKLGGGKKPSGAIVCFHGKPKIHDVLNIEWVRQAWQYPTLVAGA